MLSCRAGHIRGKPFLPSSPASILWSESAFPLRFQFKFTLFVLFATDNCVPASAYCSSVGQCSSRVDAHADSSAQFRTVSTRWEKPICALALSLSTLLTSLRNFPNVAFVTVPVWVSLAKAIFRHVKGDGGELPLSTERTDGSPWLLG